MSGEAFFGGGEIASTFTVPIFGQIDQALAAHAIGSILQLNAEDPSRAIKIYVMSYGGEVSAGLGIIDTARTVENPIATVALGSVASMGALIFSVAGDKGRRFMAPNARLMLHQPLGHAVGSASDVEIAAKELVRTRRQVNGMLAEATGMNLRRIRHMTDRDRWFTAEESVELGLADEILRSAKAASLAEDPADPGDGQALPLAGVAAEEIPR